MNKKYQNAGRHEYANRAVRAVKCLTKGRYTEGLRWARLANNVHLIETLLLRIEEKN